MGECALKRVKHAVVSAVAIFGPSRPPRFVFRASDGQAVQARVFQGSECIAVMVQISSGTSERLKDGVAPNPEDYCHQNAGRVHI